MLAAGVGDSHPGARRFLIRSGSNGRRLEWTLDQKHPDPVGACPAVAQEPPNP